ncbi:MAG: hypothetical protein M0Z95_27515 [Actinomycetota bacterium]|nr:hypothetical protein [Actinomycetota bacterium]
MSRVGPDTLVCRSAASVAGERQEEDEAFAPVGRLTGGRLTGGR